MKVNGTRGAPTTGAASGPRPSSSPGFSLQTDAAGKADAAGPAARTAGVGPVGSVDALLALQEADGPTERKRRAVKRGGRILDVLEKLKLAMLDGLGGAAALDGLVRAVREERAQTGEEGLEGVLDEIETRAAVELAKAEMSRLAA
jgi:hypothetical protein